MIFDALSMRFRELKVEKNAECQVCGADPTIRSLVDVEEVCADAERPTQEPSHDRRPETMSDPIEPPFEIGVLRQVFFRHACASRFEDARGPRDEA